tara:strand:+ start:233 stop:649 length:417 start_codon:yes stop_codon:yes gene_type:complete
MKYFNNIKNILTYYDHQPLLFWWCVSDVFNNQVLWKSYDYFLELGQPNTYWLYMVYLICSLGIVISLNNLNLLIKMITLYLSLYLFSTVRYVINIFSDMGEAFSTEDFRALFITTWYFSMWVWILLKLKTEKLHKILS